MLRLELKNGKYVKLNKMPDKCPYCHKSIEPLLLEKIRIKKCWNSCVSAPI
jgi:hypothetical protein